jgi:hypothetical protein
VPANLGVDYNQLSGNLKQRVLPQVFEADRVRISGGHLAQGVLAFAVLVANQETVTIGSNVFEFAPIATTTGLTTASGQWNNNTSDPLLVTMTAHGLVPGQVLGVDGELFQVLRVIDANTLVVARNRFGTITAAHTNGTTIYKQGALAATTDIPVGLYGGPSTNFQPAVAAAALAAAINNAPAGDGEIVVGTTGTVGTNTIYDPGRAVLDPLGINDVTNRSGKVVAKVNSDNSVLVTSAIPEASVLATTTTMAGSGDVWTSTTLLNGAAPAIKKLAHGSRVPVTEEVTLGYLYIPMAFKPGLVQIQVVTTSTGAVAAWGGNITVSGNTVVLHNTGSTDWATTHTIYYEIGE